MLYERRNERRMDGAPDETWHETWHETWLARRETTGAWREGERSDSPLLSRTVLLATLAICLALAAAMIGEAMVRRQMEQNAAALREANSSLRNQVRTLQREVEYARSDAAVEREARGWGYIRAGDVPVRIVVTPAPGKR